MDLLHRLRRTLLGDWPSPAPPAADAAPPLPEPGSPAAGAVESTAPQPGPDQGTVDARRQRAAEWLLEDERLRGDLTDEEFQPLLDWALVAIDRVVVETASQPDDVASERIEEARRLIRESVAVVDRAVARRSELAMPDFGAALRELIALARPPLVAESETLIVRARLAQEIDRLAEEKDSLDGAELTSRLAAALRSEPERAGDPA